MKLTFTELITRDHPKIVELIESRKTFVGIPAGEEAWVKGIQAATVRELYDLLQQPTNYCIVVGAWDADRLVGTLVTFSSPHQACWFLRTAYVAPDSSGSVIAAMLDWATARYEEIGLKRWMAVYTEASYERYVRLNRRTSVMERYVGNTDLVVEANVRTKFLDYWEYLYGRMLIPERTVVRCFTRADHSMSTLAPIQATSYEYRREGGAQV